jgi:hypothetical protein
MAKNIFILKIYSKLNVDNNSFAREIGLEKNLSEGLAIDWSAATIRLSTMTLETTSR